MENSSSKKSYKWDMGWTGCYLLPFHWHIYLERKKLALNRYKGMEEQILNVFETDFFALNRYTSEFLCGY